MEYPYDGLFDDESICTDDQIKSIAQKSWLSTASASLAHLDNVKTKVYNFGIADPRDLKGTNLRDRRVKPDSHQTNTEATLSNAIAWGSNNSIPELMKQHNVDGLKKPTRPASAKQSSRRSRPPSGKKPRPQSAKEPLPQTSELQQGFGVKGAKYDPSGRPPKGVHIVNTTGWVGPPAGLRYPDKPPPGAGWKIDFPHDDTTAPPPSSPDVDSDLQEVPPPPNATPIPPSPEPEPERTKRIFELFIGDPYNTGDGEEELLESDSEEELFAPPTPVQPVLNYTHGQAGSTPVQPSCTPIIDVPCPGPMDGRDSLRLDLPTMDDDYDEIDDMDTERLLAEAEFVANKFDLKQVISINQNIPVSKGPEIAPVQSGPSADTTTPTLKLESPNKLKAEVLVSKIINENGLKFDKTTEKDKIPPVLEHEKSTVKFNEDVRTVNITPRNIGRKVEELHSHKKKSVSVKKDDFVDLIQVKNRVEPVLSTGKAEMTPRKTRPPSGKSRTLMTTNLKSLTETSHTSAGQNVQSSSNFVPSAPVCHKNHVQSKPRTLNEPLNRLSRPITTVTVDYAESEEKKKTKTKKVKRNTDEVLTMMEQISLAENTDQSENALQSNTANLAQGDNSKIFEANSHVPTVYKSASEKNYYEIARHSSMSNHSVKESDKEVKPSVMSVRPESVSSVFKTTKTLEFDELEPKETTIKNVIDPVSCQTRDLDKFLAPQSLAGDIRERNRSRLNNRPASAKPPAAKKHPEESEGRPGSRLGYVAMAPDKPDHRTKAHSRPSSAPIHRHSKSGLKNKENVKEALKDHVKKTFKATVSDSFKDSGAGGDAMKVAGGNQPGAVTGDRLAGLTGDQTSTVSKEDQEKIIDNLIERTKGLTGVSDRNKGADATDATESTTVPEERKERKVVERKKVRPASAHVGLAARTREQMRIQSAANKRPASATTTRHTHRHSGGMCKATTGSKKSGGKTRTVLTEPCIINTNTDYMEEETEEDLACQKMERELSERGLKINAATLQRALYPPSGKSKYYQITADLPKKPSLSLLSHPKVWLPQEYKTLQKAEKTLARANEIMFLQKKAEERKAKLEAMSPEQREKLKKKLKKGKKGGKKLRKSLTVG